MSDDECNNTPRSDLVQATICRFSLPSRITSGRLAAMGTAGGGNERENTSTPERAENADARRRPRAAGSTARCYGRTNRTAAAKPNKREPTKTANGSSSAAVAPIHAARRARSVPRSRRQLRRSQTTEVSPTPRPKREGRMAATLPPRPTPESAKAPTKNAAEIAAATAGASRPGGAKLVCGSADMARAP